MTLTLGGTILQQAPGENKALHARQHDRRNAKRLAQAPQEQTLSDGKVNSSIGGRINGMRSAKMFYDLLYPSAGSVREKECLQQIPGQTGPCKQQEKRTPKRTSRRWEQREPEISHQPIKAIGRVDFCVLHCSKKEATSKRVAERRGDIEEGTTGSFGDEPRTRAGITQGSANQFQEARGKRVECGQPYGCERAIRSLLDTKGQIDTHLLVGVRSSDRQRKQRRDGASLKQEDLLEGQLAWVQVTDQHQGEGFPHLPLQPGDILVGDGAYSRASQLLAVQAAQAFSLTRSSPHHLPVSAKEAPNETAEFRVDVVGWLTGLRPGTYQRHGVVISDGKRLPVRLIAVVLTDEQAEALRRQKQRQAWDKGRKLSEQALFLAGFHLLVTTLPQTRWPVALVGELYRCRWQIEILFKRIKQVLNTHRLPCRCPPTAQAMIAALLVAWLLIEDEASELRRQITDGEPLALPVSSWQLNQWRQASLQNVVKGWWSPHQLLALAPEFRRLFDNKRRRPLYEHQRRVRFQTLLAGAHDLVSLFDCSSA